MQRTLSLNPTTQAFPHILDEIQEPLEKSGLVISQFPDGDGLTTMLIHSGSGEYLMAKYTMPVAKPNDPQALGSAISYSRRYAVSSILSLKIEDDDGNKATGNKVQPHRMKVCRGLTSRTLTKQGISWPKAETLK
jgi:hypothetical protein